ncbi:hypothetical protein GCM10009115_32280 [Sphingopyxis soli]|uniref:4a-hydroxytetrahydrobiopterin dehydratase n=1 Tax=Sphingopyxis soli TaxID=592051 RepID=A0ABP3XMT3_9SPHN|nr:hypothetical protein [Sphingopyxis soli]
MDNVIPIRPARTIRVWFDREGWNVQMGALHKVFWKRPNASGFIDLLLLQHIAHVEVIGDIPDE